MKLKIDKFVLSIAAVIVLAYLFPQWGAKDSNFPIDAISTIGVSLIFFFYGLKLSPDRLKAGLKNWKLHLLVQLSVFVIFPVIVLLFYPLVQTAHQETIWLALFFLAVLPSTVSSSVVMVSIAKGNIPAAIFNASISGIIGIVVTPLWMGLFLRNTNTDFDFTDIYIKLIAEIIVPVFTGILLQRFWGKYALKYNRQLTLFDKTVILLIIYKSFAESFAEKIFSTVSVSDFIVLFCAVLGLFFLVYFLTGYAAKLLKFNLEDRIAAQFCGTKKSLVHGTVFSKILFGNTAAVGIILLPLMLFHAIQILIISIIASKLAGRKSLSLLVFLLAVSVFNYSCAQPAHTVINESAGIYLTYRDFLNGKTTSRFPARSSAYTLWPQGFFVNKDPALKTPDTTVVFKRSAIWGYTDHKGRLIRVFDSKHYKVLSDKGLIIYIIYSPTKTSYYFSETLNDPICRLTRKNLTAVYADNTDLLQRIRSSKKKDWLVWDEKKKNYYLNRLFSE